MSILIDALNQFRNGEKITSFGGSKNQIRSGYNTLGRVFNDGHGFLVFAEKEGDKLYINSILLSNKEKKDIVANLTDYVLVELGYPDYYQYGLISILKKKEIETQKYNDFIKSLEIPNKDLSLHY